MSEANTIDPGGLRLELDPYPHLRDNAGCVLARDYVEDEKIERILHRDKCHLALVAALTKARGLVAKEVEDRGDNDSVYWNSAKEALAEIDAALKQARGADNERRNQNENVIYGSISRNAKS